jgi:hypothetical protein
MLAETEDWEPNEYEKCRDHSQLPQENLSTIFLMSEITIPEADRSLSLSLIFAIKLEQSDTALTSIKLAWR